MRKLVILSLVLLTSYAHAQKRPSKNTRSVSPPVQVAAGSEFACALVEGQLWCWGMNISIWADSVNRISRPVRISPDKALEAIACSEDGLIALDGTGVAWGWGDGDWFRRPSKDNTLLDREYSKKIFPVKLFDSIQWSKIDIARNHFAGIKRDGTLWVLGADECNWFGDYYYEVPRQVAKGHTWTDVDLGNIHGIVMDNNHALWTWGNNLFSQLGLGKMRTRRLGEDCTTFQQIAAGESWKAVDVSTTNAVAIHQNGSLWFWGEGAYSVFDPQFVLEPTRIGGDAVWISASTGENHTLAVREDGSLWAMGRNEHGEIGDGTTIRRTELVRIGSDNDWVLVKAASLSFSMAVKKNGTVWTWGSNELGQLGDGTTKERHKPQQLLLKTY